MELLNIRIRNRRNELNLTLVDVAKIVGVRDATIQRYESGEIKNLKQSTIMKLADALQTTPAYLMGWSDDEVPYKKYQEELNKVEFDVITKLRNMSESNKDKVIEYLEMLNEKVQKNK